ncbi:hypothetical protein FB566_3905 [Stackebrandtia endophytica]|uniref:Glycosyltransferase A (GT-A) superfamily protein (DUF2064 family) n=1 Tax=Stackebrandtia endophytica TaxID=1496996 RepID=A0A543B0G1_9ACTN|nr:DUF2064 domain-containing protein [Stackebrandtia endophytica]TQL78322.1 hypothetical protein FB566_3905 [Stackebrandtia endophytica]
MTTDPPTCILVIAKAPEPGRVKTRLCPPLTPQQAAELAEAALRDTLEAVAASPARRRVLVLAGEPGEWLPEGFEVVRQFGDGLDDRLANAFDTDDGPCLLIGMDTPQVTPELMAPALAVDAWRGVDAWFGPALDGGFWALGLARPRPDLIRGVPMSRSDTGRIQRRRLIAAGLSVRDLPPLTDVDTVSDVADVVALTGSGAFAREVDRIGVLK